MNKATFGHVLVRLLKKTKANNNIKTDISILRKKKKEFIKWVEYRMVRETTSD